MRKMIMMAIAGFLWKKIQNKIYGRSAPYGSSYPRKFRGF